MENKRKERKENTIKLNNSKRNPPSKLNMPYLLGEARGGMTQDAW